MSLFPAAAIEKARGRLDRAKKALFECRSARSYADFAEHWSEFLRHAGGVINVLETGALVSPKARQWFGQKAKAARGDELLRYMHQARNVEEHGYLPTTENEHGSITIGAGGEDLYISSFRNEAAFFRDPVGYTQGRAWDLNTGRMPTIRHSVGGPALVPVKDERHGNVFDPPSSYMGKPLKDRTPVGAAEIYVGYLDESLAEAAALT